jgi:hypothetical protein
MTSDNFGNILRWNDERRMQAYQGAFLMPEEDIFTSQQERIVAWTKWLKRKWVRDSQHSQIRRCGGAVRGKSLDEIFASISYHIIPNPFAINFRNISF